MPTQEHAEKEKLAIDKVEPILDEEITMLKGSEIRGLINIFKYCKIHGVIFFKDLEPALQKCTDLGLLVVLTNTGEEGQAKHWFAIVCDNCVPLCFFDSFGRNGTELFDFYDIVPSGVSAKFCAVDNLSGAFQTFTSCACGYYVLVFAFFLDLFDFNYAGIKKYLKSVFRDHGTFTVWPVNDDVFIATGVENDRKAIALTFEHYPLSASQKKRFANFVEVGTTVTNQ